LGKSARNVILLSGTPITHTVKDLWPGLKVMEPAVWPSNERYENRYCERVQRDYDTVVVGLKDEPEFRKVLLGQQRRVAKEDVLSELPPKTYSVRVVEMPAVYKKAYKEMQSTMLATMPDGTQLPVMYVITQIKRLTQMACSACDVTIEYEDTEEGERLPHYRVRMKDPSWKVDEGMRILEENGGPRSIPVAFWAPARQLVQLMGARAEAAGYTVAYVVGGQSKSVRSRYVEDFQAGKYDVLCATTGAGGTGLTLTAAPTAVFLQRPYSLAEALQAEDRHHRIGVKYDSVEIIDIVTRGSIEYDVRDILKDKGGQLADLLQDQRIVTQLLGGASVTELPRKE
jgi:SNF2 family DNA or RNA helicase